MNFLLPIAANPLLPLDKAYDPNQPRKPKGDPDGGQWARTSGGSVVAYHGTREKYLDSIMEEGLVASKDRTRFSADMYRGQRGESVFVANSSDEAFGYAINRFRDVRGRGIILKLHIPASKFKQFKRDHLHSSYDTARYAKLRIPPSWIKAIYDVDGELIKEVGKQDGEAWVCIVLPEGFDKHTPGGHEHDQQRHAGGDDATNEVKFKISGRGGKFRESVEAGLAGLPPDHAKIVSEVPIELVEQAKLRDGGTSQGFFEYKGIDPLRVVIGQSNTYSAGTFQGKELFFNKRVKDPGGVMVHEAGHVIDHRRGWGHSARLAGLFGEEAKGMKRGERSKAGYYTSDRGEMFAEMYRVAFSKPPSKSARVFGGMTYERALAVFPKSIEAVRNLKP